MNALQLTPANRGYRAVVTLVLAGALVMGLGGCNMLKARDKLNQGVQAFKNGKYDVAIELFKEAKELDPNLVNAQLDLAMAYQSQYIPGAPSEENQRLATQAIKEYQEVLSKDEKNLTAIDGIGAILYSSAATPFSPEKFNESKTYWNRHISIKPDDPEPYYWVGLIDWTLAFRANAEIRSKYNHANPKKQIQDDQPLPANLRDEFTAKEQQTVAEGMDYLQKAMQRRADYDDALAYFSLIHRQKADMTADAKERDDLLKKASDMMDQVKQIKQKKAQTPAGG
jgi:tetratricopeptide (TPR) repeat protein